MVSILHIVASYVSVVQQVVLPLCNKKVCGGLSGVVPLHDCLLVSVNPRKYYQRKLRLYIHNQVQLKQSMVECFLVMGISNFVLGESKQMGLSVAGRSN